MHCILCIIKMNSLLRTLFRSSACAWGVGHLQFLNSNQRNSSVVDHLFSKAKESMSTTPSSKFVFYAEIDSGCDDLVERS